MEYDPNYEYKQNAEEIDMEGWEEEDGGWGQADNQDDDDSSWKVRRGSL